MNVSVVGKWSGDGFKKSTGSGVVSTFVRRRGDEIVTAVVPSEKFRSILASVGVSDAVVFCLDSETNPKEAGEMALLSNFIDVPVYAIDNGFYMWDSLKGTKLYSAKRISNVLDVEPVEYGEDVLVHVDQSFVVSGKGNIVLGFLKSGKVEKHDVLYSTAGEISVKSIQINSKDVSVAYPGSRIGFLVKSNFQVPDHDILIGHEHEFANEFSFSESHGFSKPPKQLSVSAGTIMLPAEKSGNLIKSHAPVGNWKLFAFSNDVFPRILGTLERA